MSDRRAGRWVWDRRTSGGKTHKRPSRMALFTHVSTCVLAHNDEFDTVFNVSIQLSSFMWGGLYLEMLMAIPARLFRPR